MREFETDKSMARMASLVVVEMGKNEECTGEVSGV